MRKLFIVLSVKQKEVFVPAPESEAVAEEEAEYIEEVDMTNTIEEKDYRKYTAKTTTSAAASKVNVVDS